MSGKVSFEERDGRTCWSHIHRGWHLLTEAQMYQDLIGRLQQKEVQLWAKRIRLGLLTCQGFSRPRFSWLMFVQNNEEAVAAVAQSLPVTTFKESQL